LHINRTCWLQTRFRHFRRVRANHGHPEISAWAATSGCSRSRMIPSRKDGTRRV
jgi:hypothetical protein